MRIGLITFILAIGLLVNSRAAERITVKTFVQPPSGYTRLSVQQGTFAASLRELELVPDTVIMSGDGKTTLCFDEKVAATRIAPFDNKNDVGVDGIAKLWGSHLWNRRSGSAISFPLDNGQVAAWKDWRDGLRPKSRGGQFIFTQVTTPDGGYANYLQYLSFVSEEMGALAIRRESTILVDDSLAVGDLMVAVRKNGKSAIGLIVDMCKGPRGERLYLMGTCGTPSASFYIMRPFSPVQGLNEWFTLDGAKWAIGEGTRVDLRRVTLK